MTRPARREKSRPPGGRRGAVLVLIVVAMIPIVACMAFAIDMGMLTVAQTQLRDAADAAALAGCRALNGKPRQQQLNNYTGVAPGRADRDHRPTTSWAIRSRFRNLTLNIGQYAYNSTAQQFQGSFPSTLTSGNWNMVQAIVTTNLRTASVSARFSISRCRTSRPRRRPPIRPRDICVILDYSGSMRFSSLLGTPYSGNTRLQQPGHGGAGVRPVFRRQRHHRHAGGGRRGPLWKREYLHHLGRRASAGHSRLLYQ